MSKSWPDFMGTYKGIVLDTGLQKAKTSGMPQFAVRIALSEYYDAKEDQWYSVEDNNWSITGYFTLYGRKNSQPDGDIVSTLNHQQVCKVFGWDGRGFGHLIGNDFSGKIVQVRIEENTYEGAKSPVSVAWIDTEDADPNPGLQKLDEKGVKELETEFAAMWKSTPAPKAPVAKAPAKPKAAPKAAPKPPAEPPAEPETPPADPKEAKKKALLEKSKRIQEANKKEAEKAAEKAKATPPAPPAKGKAKEPPTQSDEKGDAIPEGYDKKQAWNDVLDLKDANCDDDQLTAVWNAAIAEIAEDGDEDKLDAAGWWAVKESVLNDIGTL